MDYSADELAAVRKSSSFAEMRSQMASIFDGKTCLAIGSAPGATCPPLSDVEATICVNGSGWTARQFGIGSPELTVVSSRLTKADNMVRKITQTVWEGLHTKQLLLIDSENADLDIENALRVISSFGLQFDVFGSIDPIYRAAIVGDVCGEELGKGKPKERVSNGVFAVCIPIWAGASRVILSGFSNQGDHAYISHKTTRGHLVADTRFFELAGSLSVPLETTAPALAERFNIPLTV